MNKILIADSNKIFRIMIEKYLKKKEYSVIVSSTGKEALSKTISEKPDCVLLSVELGEMSGIEVCKSIKEAYDVPVLIITSKDDDSFVDDAFKAGASDYVLKPINWSVLSRRLEHEISAAEVIRRLKISESKFSSLFHRSPLPYMSVNRDGVIVDANQALEGMLETDAAKIINSNIISFIHHKDRKRFLKRVNGFDGPCRINDLWVTVISCSGSQIDIAVNGDIMFDEDEFSQANLIFQDITKRKELEKELRILATQDPLTGVDNRRSFFDKAEQELLRNKRYVHDFSIIMLDIDYFKRINDTFGHSVGDSVLRLTSQVISQELRESDILGRMGGEEFAIAMPETSLKDAYLVAERIRMAVEGVRLETNKGFVDVKLSAGVFTMSCEDKDKDIHYLIRQADILMYRAKKNGRNRVEVG